MPGVLKSKGNKNQIGVKLILLIIMFSSLITLITTAIQLYTDYRRDVGTIKGRIENIKKIELRALRHSLWNFDGDSIQIQLESMLNIQGIEYLKLSSDQDYSWQVGKIKSQYTFSDIFNIYYDEDETTLIGTLTIVSGLDPIFQRLLDKALIIFIGNAVKTFIVAIFAIFVFRLLVSRHLIQIASYVKQMEFDNLADELVLEGKKTDRDKPDEIDQIASAINELKREHTMSLNNLTEEIRFRKQAEEDLRKSEGRLRGIVEGTQAGYFHIDNNGYIQNVNDAWLHMHRYTDRNQVIGKHFSMVQTETDSEKAEDIVRAVLDGTLYRHGEFSRHCRDGSIGYHTYSVNPVYNGEDIIGMEGFIIDTTERRKAEQEKESLQMKLAQARKMESIGKLAGGIAHDFNNILASVLGYTELALEDVEKGSMIESWLRDVYSAGKRARDLVRQILTFARRSDEQLVPIRVDHIIRETLNFIRSTTPATIEVVSSIESKSFVMATQTQIHQMMMNLCINAVHAMEETGGILRVRQRDVHIDENSDQKHLDLSPGDHVEITVSDSGVGIPPDIMESIFEPYFTTKGLGQGTGMGLAIVHGIVTSYGGRILVDSTPGQGSVFTIYIPVTDNQILNAESKARSLPKGTERILFIDDEVSLAKMGGQILTRLGYSVTIETDALEALQLFQAKSPEFDLVITDMTMPHMTGDSLAIHFLSIRPDIPIIICTGYSKRMTEARAAQIGIKAFAFKPVSMQKLAEMVRNVLDNVNPNHTSNR